MPIFRKNNERVLFVHIPKNAGTTVEYWFCENYWYITNLALYGHEKQIFNESFGINFTFFEGYQAEEKTNPQHALPVTWKKWGEFTSAFAIVRHPLERLRSHVNYKYRSLVKLGRLNDTANSYAKFLEEYLTDAFRRLIKEPTYQDNHFRPQTDFLAEGVTVLKFESNWPKFIAEKYHLKTKLPHINISSVKKDYDFILPDELKKKIVDYYHKDFEILGYSLPVSLKEKNPLKKIWLYWENKGDSKPPSYIDLCHETVFYHLQNDYQIIILNDKNIENYLENIHQNYWKITCLAHKADYIRAKIVFKYGGMWLDSDVIMLEKKGIDE